MLKFSGMHACITGKPVSHTVTWFYDACVVCVGVCGCGWVGVWLWVDGLVWIITKVMVGNGYGFLKLHNDSREFQHPN